VEVVFNYEIILGVLCGLKESLNLGVKNANGNGRAWLLCIFQFIFCLELAMGSGMKKRYRVGIIPGDGIGRDVVRAAMIVLDAVNDAAEKFALEFGKWRPEKLPWPNTAIPFLPKLLRA